MTHTQTRVSRGRIRSTQGRPGGGGKGAMGYPSFSKLSDFQKFDVSAKHFGTFPVGRDSALNFIGTFFNLAPLIYRRHYDSAFTFRRFHVNGSRCLRLFLSCSVLGLTITNLYLLPPLSVLLCNTSVRRILIVRAIAGIQGFAAIIMVNVFSVLTVSLFCRYHLFSSLVIAFSNGLPLPLHFSNTVCSGTISIHI